MTVHEAIHVYQGDSVRADNGQQVNMPVFGRFAAVVNHGTYLLVETTHGWHISLPYGVTMPTINETEDEVREAWQRIKLSLLTSNANGEGWTTDIDAAKRVAIAKAAERHNAAATRTTYAKRFGGPVTMEAAPV